MTCVHIVQNTVNVVVHFSVDFSLVHFVLRCSDWFDIASQSVAGTLDTSLFWFVDRVECSVPVSLTRDRWHIASCTLDSTPPFDCTYVRLTNGIWSIASCTVGWAIRLWYFESTFCEWVNCVQLFMNNCTWVPWCAPMFYSPKVIQHEQAWVYAGLIFLT